MTIAAILDSISQHRFATYKSSVFNGASEEECLGIYLWNKQLAGAFLPALQIIEVSLRNAICTAKKATRGDTHRAKGACGRLARAEKPHRRSVVCERHDSTE
ncbi:Abi family protein [Pantoea agglomerans]|nr:Abi family protein [Pantoea agglomerans]